MKSTEELRAAWAAEIAAAGAATEAQMREAKVPTPETPDELADYVRTLLDRPHDYGTCCYAMSMAAVAAYNLVASRLGVTGFQASCADLDVLRRTRGWEWGRLVDYADLLYPQYCTAEKFPSWEDLLSKNRVELAKRAADLLAETPQAHPDVLAHWRRLVAAG